MPAAKATAAPPVGPALGANGVKAIDFCKAFNARTAHLQPGLPTPTKIHIEPDRTFSFVVRSPPAAYLLKRAAGLDSGAATHTEPVGTLSLKHIYEIARIKVEDDHLRPVGLQNVARMILGTAKSVGIRIVK